MFSRFVSTVFAVIAMSSSAQAVSPVAKVRVSVSGQVALNDKAINLQALDAALAKLSAEHGVVWYYCESAKNEPPAQAMEVVQLVVKYRLPISMSSKPDFSDVIDANGNSVPRKP